MPLGGEPRDLELVGGCDADALWKRCNLLSRIGSFHGEQLSSRGEQVNSPRCKLHEVRQRSGGCHFKQLRRREGLRARGLYFDIRKAKLRRELPEERGLLLVAVEQRDMPARASNRQRDAG